MKKLILLAVIASALFSSCQKNNTPAPNAKNAPGGINEKNRPVLTTDVYVAGDALASGRPPLPFSAYYWKNGVPTQLLTSGTGNSHAQAITVSGTDIYVAGYANSTDQFSGSSNPGLPCLWKNGVEQLLPIPAGHLGAAQGIAVSGPDVYVVGYYVTNDATHSRRAMLWKNGVDRLMAFNTFDSIATGIALDGTDVYVCGNAVFSGVTCAVYWKNNIWHPFAGTTVTSRAAAITVDARHNYYISGGSNGVACYWKNTTLVPLPDDLFFPDSRLNDCIFYNMLSVDNNNVYVSGVHRTIDERTFISNAYWKNGLPVLVLPPPGLGLGEMDAGALNSIVVINNVVYDELTYDADTGAIGGYYANNVFTSIGTASPGAIAVVQH
jgi:hypothetical protein